MYRRHFLALSGGAFGLAAGCQESESADTQTTATSEATPAATATATDAPATSTPTAEERSLTTPEPRLFTGDSRTFVVNGYSTSFDWPEVLQHKLDRYFDGERVIEVAKALEPGTPIADWLNPDTGERYEPWGQTLAPALDQDDPVIALGQQSLQGCWGDFRTGIRGTDDEERVVYGADVLDRYATALLEDGAEHVYVATHIYKEPFEPVIGNERYALARLASRDPPGFTRGPDVWEPTKAHWPEAFQDDEVHPDDVGAEIMAHYWFRRLLVSDVRGVPAWSREEMETAIAERT